MTDKTPQEKNAAARQIELMIHALENAKNNDGVWLNATGKTAPRFYPKGATVSAFNSLTLALHSDKNGYDTNQYTLFNEARHRGESVLAKEKGVPFNWYNWSQYVNKHNPEDKISRNDYLKLDPDEKKIYKGVKNREIRILFNIQQTTLPLVDKEKYDKELLYHGNSNARGNLEKEEKTLRMSMNQLVALTKKNMIPIRRDASGVAHYDTTKDAVYMPDKKNFSDYKDYVREMLRQLVTATGHQQRLAREGMAMNGGRAPVEDERKQERLVTELATGVKCLELGIPAKLSPDSMNLVEYWSRELKEDPKLLDSIESDVNNAVDMIHKIEKDEKVERNTVQTNQEITELSEQLPKHYYVAEEIKGLPNKDTKLFVIVKDPANKSAEVVMPSGASLEVNNEIPGMSKQRIETALHKEGFDTVSFYNTDGALGYRKDDSYFGDKEIVVAKLNNWKIDETTKLDVSDAVDRAGNVDFEKILMLKDDDGKWALFLKAENEPSFSIYPDKTDTNRFFTTLKQGREEATEQVRVELANKYYLLAKNRPELKKDIFKSSEENLDLSRLERVNVYKTKEKPNEPSKILCLPVIKGESDVKPREVSPQQWQRMWLADDKQEYKFQLAASLFADVLRKEVKMAQEAKADLDKKIETIKEEKNEKDSQEANDRKEEEQSKEKKADSPVLEQYTKLKEKHPDAVFLFRNGSFYESYFEDAKKVSAILGLALTAKQFDNVEHEKIPMVTFPTPSLDLNLPKLIRAGERVAICDELLEKKAKVNEMVVPTKAVEEEQQQSHLKR